MESEPLPSKAESWRLLEELGAEYTEPEPPEPLPSEAEALRFLDDDDDDDDDDSPRKRPRLDPPEDSERFWEELMS